MKPELASGVTAGINEPAILRFGASTKRPCDWEMVILGIGSRDIVLTDMTLPSIAGNRCQFICPPALIASDSG